MAKPDKHVFVCTQSRPAGHPRGSCTERGAQDLMMAFGEQFEEKGLWGKCMLTPSGCIGACDNGPAVLVYPEGVLYTKVTKDDIAEIVDNHLIAGEPVERLKAAPELW